MVGYAENKDAVQQRLKRIEGQVRGLQRMVESDTYGVDVLTQISAKDPVCGMQVERANAPASVDHDGERVYFCSEAAKAALPQSPNVTSRR